MNAERGLAGCYRNRKEGRNEAEKKRRVGGNGMRVVLRNLNSIFDYPHGTALVLWLRFKRKTNNNKAYTINHI